MADMDATIFGRLADGRPVHTHRLEADGIAVDVLDLGATVHRVLVPDATGVTRNVVLGHGDPAAYLASSSYLGCVVGRYANRIADGRFTLDGVEYELTTNDGANTLHGGVDGYDKRLWTVHEAEPTRLVLGLVSPDGDQGFPGELSVTVTYSVAPGELQVGYAATTSAPTVVNLTNHGYLNLEGEGAWSVDRHLLRVDADHYVPTTADSLPLPGGIAPVDGTALDLREPRVLGEQLRLADDQLLLAGGIDHSLVVRGSGLREHAVLSAPESGITMTLLSDQPSVQVYTGNYLDGRVVGTSGRAYRQGAGIALETQHLPDSPHHGEFPSTVLRPGETFTSTTRWRFTTQG